mgnify:CR=1 FL=1
MLRLIAVNVKKLIPRYPVIFKFRDGTGRVIEKKIGSGRVPGSRQTLLLAEVFNNFDNFNKKFNNFKGFNS